MATVLIIGLGITGLACCHYYQKQGMTVRVLDTRMEPPLLAQLSTGIAFKGGELQLEDLQSADTIILSPGVSLQEPALVQARALNLPFKSDIDVFFEQTNAPVVGITGSNGKSTVTMLLGEMARIAGFNVGVGGNLGVPALDLLAPERDCYILELSSFQLERSDALPLAAAAFLNFSADHLEVHGSYENYWHAKQRIFLNAKHTIVSRDDDKTWPQRHSPSVTFGLDNQDYGRLLYQDEMWLCVHKRPILPISKLGLVGEHNHRNALAAMALADIFEIPEAAQCQALVEFKGLPHRCQVVSKRHDVVWINDSKATNVGATQAALEGLGEDKKNIILLVGGQAKGQDMRELYPWITRYVRMLICYGEDAKLFLSLHTNTHEVSDLSAAVQLANTAANAGDLVLLSPACASFDLFSSFEHRGQVFTELVEKL